MNSPLDNPFAPPAADISPPRPGPGAAGTPGPGDGAISRLIFRWEGCRFLYDAALGLILWRFWDPDEPRLWRGTSAVVLSVSAIILNIAFTFGPTVACHFEPSRWSGRWVPVSLAGGGILLALASIALALAG